MQSALRAGGNYTPNEPQATRKQWNMAEAKAFNEKAQKPKSENLLNVFCGPGLRFMANSPGTVAPVIQTYTRSRFPRPARGDRRFLSTNLNEKSPPADSSRGPSLLQYKRIWLGEVASRGQLPRTVAPVVQTYTRSRLPRPTPGTVAPGVQTYARSRLPRPAPRDRRSCITNVYEKSPPAASSQGPSLL